MTEFRNQPVFGPRHGEAICTRLQQLPIDEAVDAGVYRHYDFVRACFAPDLQPVFPSETDAPQGAKVN
jgi:hypothetical protein